MANPVPSQVAIIGAGLSGLSCARTLTDRGLAVTIFEKSRGIGGRMSTRRTETGLCFDHGAQYFTARDLIFQKRVETWIEQGVVEAWNGRIVVIEAGVIRDEATTIERYVALPGMNALCKNLAEGINVVLNTQVDSISKTKSGWTLTSSKDESLGQFDGVVVSAPAGQTATLLADVPTLADPARSVTMNGCWAVMLAIPSSLNLNYAAAFVNNSPLAWIACNSSKPGRPNEPETWVLHASADWTRAHFDDPPEDAQRLLIDAFCQATGTSNLAPQFSTAHRWKFALPPEPLAESCLFDETLRIGACGDWCGGPRVEGAFLSGLAVADKVLTRVENS